MFAGDSTPENKQAPPNYNIKDLWIRGRFWEIFGFTKGDFTALELTQKYSALSTTYRNNLDELRLVDDAFATLNAPLTRQFYEGCRFIMQRIRREIGDNNFEQAEIEIWTDLWGWVYQRWQEPPEGLITELIKRYAQGKTEKRPCPNCGENLHYDFELLLWKCRNPNCRHIYTYRELRDRAARGKTQEDKRSQPPSQTQPHVTQQGKKRRRWWIPVTIVLTIVVVAIVVSTHSRQEPTDQTNAPPQSPTTFVSPSPAAEPPAATEPTAPVTPADISASLVVYLDENCTKPWDSTNIPDLNSLQWSDSPQAGWQRAELTVYLKNIGDTAIQVNVSATERPELAKIGFGVTSNTVILKPGEHSPIIITIEQNPTVLSLSENQAEQVTIYFHISSAN
jgi:hypothetical protein